MELFIKRFIDLLDETSPVSMVHTLTEQPLGAVTNDYYIRIHSRIDLVDEVSPYVEIELYPYEYKKIECLFAYTYPKQGIRITEEQFIRKILDNNKVKAEKITPLKDENDYYYEVFYEEEINIPENSGETDKLIHEIIPKIKEFLTIGGFSTDEEVEEDE